MTKYFVDFHGTILVEAKDEEEAYERACGLVETAKNDKDATAIDEIISVVQMDSETITEDVDTE